MAIPTLFNGWLKYDVLDAPCPDLSASFALGYRFTGEVENDTWSSRFNGVKFYTEDKRYSEAAVAIMNLALRSLLSKLRLAPEDVLFTAVLSSNQISGRQGNVMQRIAVATSQSLGSRFDGLVLTKQPHAQLRNSPGAQARREIVERAGYKAGRVDSRSVFVFDDFITTGTTLGAIATAIRRANPKVSVYGVALAKTERRNFAGGLTNRHIPAAWSQAWENNFRR